LKPIAYGVVLCFYSNVDVVTLFLNWNLSVFGWNLDYEIFSVMIVIAAHQTLVQHLHQFEISGKYWCINSSKHNICLNNEKHIMTTEFNRRVCMSNLIDAYQHSVNIWIALNFFSHIHPEKGIFWLMVTTKHQNFDVKYGMHTLFFVCTVDIQQKSDIVIVIGFLTCE
jgi:hypothetical protein